MAQIHTIHIDPPLINSSCPWASDLDQLRELYNCRWTGAVTTRTATLVGFNEDESHKVSDELFCCVTLTYLQILGCFRKGLSIVAQFIWILPSPPVNLPPMDPHHVILDTLFAETETIHHQYHFLVANRTVTHDRPDPRLS